MNLFDVYPLYDITPVKGNNVFVFDENGKEYLDLYGGHAVISIGHSHPQYVTAINRQVQKLGFYSNSVNNPLQTEFAKKLGKISKCEDYDLFLCNSGAEANENALKLASFHTGKNRLIYFENAFHGRTSAAVSVTDNQIIKAPVNNNHLTTKLAFEDLAGLELELQKGNIAALIVEIIQGVGGLEEATTNFYKKAAELCKEYGALFIVDEVQSGYGRTGDFFAFQHHGIKPDIISIAKGMGNGFPIGGILIGSHITAKKGMLGTTFGGNHLACAAGIAVLEVLAKEKLMQNAQILGEYFYSKAKEFSEIKNIKGRGLMIGLEFNFEIAELRKELLFNHHIFTGAASNKKMLRILPPLCIQKKHLDRFFNALEQVLKTYKAQPLQKS
jgi:acetylornithine/N-succinyldiaminopimelate aminotransferase